jgi:hypothetical protein
LQHLPFGDHPLGLTWCCKGLSECANVLAPSNPWFLLGGFMKKLVAMIFFAMLAGNAMAQAAGAGAAGGSAAGATAGTVAVVAAGVVGIAAAGSASSSSNH